MSEQSLKLNGLYQNDSALPCVKETSAQNENAQEHSMNCKCSRLTYRSFEICPCQKEASRTPSRTTVGTRQHRLSPIDEDHWLLESRNGGNQEKKK